MIAHGTPIDWYNFCRGVAEDIVINNSEKIGGIKVTVEIDESKFGKRKYNRGKKVDGVWVFGEVERGSGQCFLVLVPDRSADTLLDIIKEWILPGSIIISDCWKAYDKIEEHNEYIHLKVNHSLNFKDPETGKKNTNPSYFKNFEDDNRTNSSSSSSDEDENRQGSSANEE
ncbi:hypothetical protein GHT06_009907 [Daphnia sinensis]|uniref:ISXO2-like transposase domain-containing protein n=1 Tax=Daphnia sinensis TaxID=1820382 RepID=A0AAD5KXB5_9CRUS|nr:hypothetical protein GHT06_009907 [Daphnia sinensis]